MTWCIVVDPYDPPTKVIGPFDTEPAAYEAAREIFEAGDYGVAVVPLEQP